MYNCTHPSHFNITSVIPVRCYGQFSHLASFTTVQLKPEGIRLKQGPFWELSGRRVTQIANKKAVKSMMCCNYKVRIPRYHKTTMDALIYKTIV
jgi:hypothetical protein